MTVDLTAPWREEAACRENPALFDRRLDRPDGHEEHLNARKARYITAARVCLRCPVGGPCLADVDLELDQGIRGGHVIDDGQLWPLVEWLRKAEQMGGVPRPREHGTQRGYWQHRDRNDMPACDSCLRANRKQAAS